MAGNPKIGLGVTKHRGNVPGTTEAARGGDWTDTKPRGLLRSFDRRGASIPSRMPRNPSELSSLCTWILPRDTRPCSSRYPLP